MATGPNIRGLMILPWYNTAEWKTVKDSLCSLDDKAYALKRIKFWEKRTPLLPCGVAGTLVLLQVFSYELLQNLPEELRIDMKCYALMKFLNVGVAGRSKQGEFVKCLKAAGLPEYLINIRNFVSHTNEKPSEDLLNIALKHCYEFVLENYWERQDECLYDFVNLNAEDAQLQLYCEMNYLQCSKNYETLGEVFDNNLTIVQLDRFMKGKSYRHLKVDDYMNQIFNQLRESVSTVKFPSNIFSGCTTEQFRDNENVPKRRLTDASLNIWKDLVLLYGNSPNSLVRLIEHLIKVVITQQLEVENRIASVWLAEIFANLLQTKNYKETDRLNLNMKNVDEVISKLKVFQGIILNQSKPNMINFIKSFLLLFDFPKDYIDYKVQRVAAESNSVFETPEALKKYEEENIENLPLIDFSENFDDMELEPPKDLVKRKLQGGWSRADPIMVRYLRRKNARMNPYSRYENSF